MYTPNVYGDVIEWFHRQVKNRDTIVLSLHPHNDRGCAVAAAEFGVMAGADRVEGTLFGNGERTGNVDLVTLALNMYSQGVHPGLDFSRLNEAIECAEFCNQLPVHPRHPYAGNLVFTAFSGSHQDAIKKGFAAQAGNGLWSVPYLPIDPKDIGRSYEPIIRVNSQSGKGGVAFLLERDYGIKLPRRLQIEFSRVIQQITDRTGGEVTSAEIWRAFEAEYVRQQQPLAIRNHSEHSTEETGKLTATVSDGQVDHVISGDGAGPIDAFVHAINQALGIDVRILDYQEHAIGSGANARAISFVEIQARGGDPLFGVGIHRNIVTASLTAITSAVNRDIRNNALAFDERHRLTAVKTD
jgi:2-isopropylmalate synthase